MDEILEHYRKKNRISVEEHQRNLENAKEKSPNAALESENADLMFKTAVADMRMDSLEGENAEMMFRLAMIEMGGNA